MSSTALPELDPEEIEALRSAAAWYASYFRDEIAGEAHDPSAYATVERERYLALCRRAAKARAALRAARRAPTGRRRGVKSGPRPREGR